MTTKKTDLESLISALLSPSTNPPPPPPQDPTVNFLQGLLGPLQNSPIAKPQNNALGSLLGGTQPPALGGLMSGLATPPKSVLGGLLGLSPNSHAAPAARPALPTPPPSVVQKARHVFYSFHYADVFRVNHVRQSGKIRPGDKGITVRDRSLWESVKRTDPQNLRRVINQGLTSTSVTCVLAGTETWEREWVRYEIARSLVRGNGLLTVFIDGCKCPRSGIAPRGHNPLDFLAVGWNEKIYEWVDDGWYPYSKIQMKLPVWPRWLRRPSEGHVTQLSTGAFAYDWIADQGYTNLIHWTNEAAKRAGR